MTDTRDPAPDPTIAGTTFRHVLGHYPTGVCIVTARLPTGDPVGMVVGSFTSVSLDPPLVGFLPDRRSTTWPRIETAGAFCVNVLGSDQEALCRRFAAAGADRFADVGYRLSDGGSPIIEGVVSWIDCRLHAVHEAGDHYIVLGRILDLAAERPSHPLLFFRGGYGSFAP